MKKIITILVVLSAFFSATAQNSFYVFKKDGSKVEYKISDVDSVGFVATTTPVAENTLSFTVNKVLFNMIFVEGGTFMMGATEEQLDEADENEKPVHQVTVSSYYIAETEVTQELWMAVMGENPSYDRGDPIAPVEDVSWNDCQDFIKKLNELTGKTFSLPTEAQWEFAARGGNKTQGYMYAGSNDIDEVAWYNNYKEDYTYIHTVTAKAPNELGLYDMSGNVSEWCNDWYGGYTRPALVDPQGPSYGTNKVCRGGNFLYGVDECRVSDRVGYNTSDEGKYIGLRLCLVSE